MGDLEVFEPFASVKYMMFGFLSVFGFNNVRFLELVRVPDRSVCSVDFVDKMWRSLWESLCVRCGKNCGKVVGREFYTENSGVLHIEGDLVEKYPLRFAHNLTEVRWGFAQFPQSLLQLLLIR